MGFLNDLYSSLQQFIIVWWPWLNIVDDISLIQFFLIWTFIYIYYYNNIYYSLLYVFINFFLIGIYLSIFQIELFTAFLWLVECSVLFIFLLLLFFLNVKGVFSYNQNNKFVYVFLTIFFLNVAFINPYFESECKLFDLNVFNFNDNYYESILNGVTNDLFGFSISYYILNGVEFIIVGFLLLVGSVVCVNLYQMNKNVRVQSYSSFLSVFNFFMDFSSFFLLRRQNLIKQGNTKASLKVFKKK